VFDLMELKNYWHSFSKRELESCSLYLKFLVEGVVLRILLWDGDVV